MRKSVSVFVSVLFGFTAATWASQPGQHLDCSDWVFLEPGYTCTTEVSLAPCSTNSLSCLTAEAMFVGNDGYRYTVTNEHVRDCSARGDVRRTNIVRMNGATETVIAYVEDRCLPDGESDRTLPGGLTPILFDTMNGTMFLKLEVDCTGGNICSPQPAGRKWMAAIHGFTTTFEILQTYSLGTSTLGFRVPAMPEGFRAADHFDTYWGNVADLPNFKVAHPMQCGYPTSAPSPGDYLDVPDTSPQPGAGSANYNVTGVSYQGQRRYGRKLIGGVLSGRDPALLPTCK